MFRCLAFTIIIAGACSAGSVHAGALEALSHGGPDVSSFQGLWSPAPGAEHYESDENIRVVFRVRYYKMGWKYKRYAAFSTLVEAKQFLLKKQMEGYTSNLSIHEFSVPPKRR